MRHRKAGIKLNRTTSHREAMFKNMVTSLFKYDRIRTTDVKAKELRRLADNLVTLAKRGDLHARRQALSIIREKIIVHKLFSEAAERYGNIGGGYTRVVKIGRRPGDAAPISLVELVAIPAKIEKKIKKAKKQESTKKTSQEDKIALKAPAAKVDESLQASKSQDKPMEAKKMEEDILSVPGKNDLTEQAPVLSEEKPILEVVVGDDSKQGTQA